MYVSFDGQSEQFLLVFALWLLHCYLSVSAHGLCVLAVVSADASLLNKSMPLGPVAGGIMGSFLLLALAVYCYRCFTRRRSRHCDGSLPGEARLRDSNVDFDDTDDGRYTCQRYMWLWCCSV